MYMCSKITWLMSYSTNMKSGEEHQHCSLLYHPLLSICHLLVGQQVAKTTIVGISLNSPPPPLEWLLVLSCQQVKLVREEIHQHGPLIWPGQGTDNGDNNICCIFLLFKANWVSFNLSMGKSSYQAISQQDQCWRSINHSLFICKIFIHSLSPKLGRQLSFPVFFAAMLLFFWYCLYI